MSADLIYNRRVGNSFIAPITINAIPFAEPIYVTREWICPVGVTSVSALCIAGGGGSPIRVWNGAVTGGSGAGGVKMTGGITVTPGTKYTVTVGGGGASSNGNTSSFSTLASAAGGGNGDGGNANAGNGGSGGGAGGGINTIGGGSPGTGITGQGNNGASGYSGTSGGGGGGGGAGGTGSPGTSAAGGAGGSAKTINIYNNFISNAQIYSPTFQDGSLIVGGGGGGAMYGGSILTPTTGGIGGTGGGTGDSLYLIGTAVYKFSPNVNGTAQLGGGSGGGGYYDGVTNNGALGGSGHVILYGYFNPNITIKPIGNLNLTGSKILYCYSPGLSTISVFDFNKRSEYFLTPTGLSGLGAGYILFPPYGQNFGTLYYDISGAAGGSGASGGGQTGGRGGYVSALTGCYINNLSAAVFFAAGKKGSDGISAVYTGQSVPPASGGDGGTGYYNGGRGGAGGTVSFQSSAGGGGGGGASIVLDSNGGLLAYAVGGGGGGGGVTAKAGLNGDDTFSSYGLTIATQGGPGRPYFAYLYTFSAFGINGQGGGGGSIAGSGGGGAGGGGGQGGTGGTANVTAAGGGATTYYDIYPSGAVRRHGYTKQDGLIRLYIV